jgi:hypothetical protein
LCAGHVVKALKRRNIMGITRRQFLFSIPAAGAGFILPFFFDKAVDVLAKTGEPLIIPPDECVTELLAIDHGTGEFHLNIGDPWEEPPRMTIREYIEKYRWSDVEEYIEDVYGEDADIDPDIDLVDDEIVLEAWAVAESPNARAFYFLNNLDLGMELSGPNAAGELRFIQGCCPGNDYTGVHAANLLTISLLQERLNQLSTRAYIQVE